MGQQEQTWRISWRSVSLLNVSLVGNAVTIVGKTNRERIVVAHIFKVLNNSSVSRNGHPVRALISRIQRG